MSCTTGEIACELHRIADAVTGFDLSGFASTLIATLAGAAVALVGAAFLAHRDRSERYRTRLDEALARALPVIAAYGDALDLYGALQAQQPGATARAMPLPSTIEPKAALTVVRLLARKSDQEIAEAIYKAFTDAVAVFPQQGLPVVEAIPDVILRWRHGDPHGTVLGVLRDADQRSR